MNTSPQLLWSNVVKKAEEMTLRMQFSGQNKQLRYQVVDSAVKAFREIYEEARSGERPLHRLKRWKRKERKKQRMKKKEDWYKKGRSRGCV
mgnify:FL=1